MPGNIEKIHNLIEKHDLDALIITNPDSMRYLGYDMWFDHVKEWMTKAGGGNGFGSSSMCVICRGKMPVFLLSAFSLSFYKGDLSRVLPYGRYTGFEKKSPKSQFWEENKRIIDILSKGVYEDAYDALEHAVYEMDLKKSRIAIEYDGINPNHRQAIERILKGCVLSNGSELIRISRLYKTDEEVELLKNCFDITEKAFLKAANLIDNGVSLGQLHDCFRDSIESEGAIYQHFSLMQSGLGMTEDKNHIFNDRMILGLDAGIVYKGYISDTGLTVFLGSYDKKDLEVYRKLSSIIEEGFSIIRPGVRCLDVYKAMKSRSDELGVTNAVFEGHGVGLSFREYPFINANVEYNYNNGFEKTSANFALEKSMVINLELGYHIFAEKTFQIEKTVLVTENGMEPIVKQERDLPIMIK